MRRSMADASSGTSGDTSASLSIQVSTRGSRCTVVARSSMVRTGVVTRIPPIDSSSEEATTVSWKTSREFVVARIRRSTHRRT